MEDTLLLLLLLLLLPNTCGRTSIHPNTRTHITGEEEEETYRWRRFRGC